MHKCFRLLLKTSSFFDLSTFRCFLLPISSVNKKYQPAILCKITFYCNVWSTLTWKRCATPTLSSAQTIRNLGIYLLRSRELSCLFKSVIFPSIYSKSCIKLIKKILRFTNIQHNLRTLCLLSTCLMPKEVQPRKSREPFVCLFQTDIDNLFLWSSSHISLN